MEELKRYVFDGEEYISKKSLLKCLREISDAVNSFSDRADPIRIQGANKVISLLLEKIEPPREHWKPSEEQMDVDLDSEIEEYWIATEWSKAITLGKFKVIARYFYGLGQLNSK